MRVLEYKVVTVDNNLTLNLHDGGGHRRIMRGKIEVVVESDTEVRNIAILVVDAGPLTGKSVAWIGGGFCVGPRICAIAECHQTVYEIEPALAEFCPPGVTFVPGDWRDTLTGKYDVIFYDLGGDVPRGILSQHLNRSGAILPKEN